MQVKISRPEAYSLMSENDHAVMNERINELNKVIGDKSDFDLNFYFDDEKSELFLEIVSQEQKILYRLMFKVKRSVGRPSTGTTKKVSLTLPDETWELIASKKNEWGVSQSQALRMMLEGHLANYHESKFCSECAAVTDHLKNDENNRLYCKNCGLYHN